MDQGVAHAKRRGPVEELHLVSSELPGDVPTRRLVGFYCCHVSFHHTCSQWKKQEQEGRSENGTKQTLAPKVKVKKNGSVSPFTFAFPGIHVLELLKLDGSGTLVKRFTFNSKHMAATSTQTFMAHKLGCSFIRLSIYINAGD